MSKQSSLAPLRRGIVKLWFALDAVVALAPPLYWAADGRTTPVAGIPTALLYFLAVNVCITGSLIAAYFLDAVDDGSAA